MSKTILNDGPKKAVIYCRVSTKEQVDEGNSLVSQERICREYATKEGYEITEVFIEKGESAKTADRTELKRLMTFCTSKKGLVQAVIAYKVDRISRSIADYSHIRVLLKKYGVEIKSVTEYFEDTPAGRFMENIIANVGQFDNDVRTERSIGGMREAVNEGRYVWLAPYGYDNVRTNGKSNLKPNDKAALMAEAFDLIAKQTHSTDTVRLLLAKKGLVGKKGLPIARSNFFRLVRNPLYMGTIKMLGMTVKGTFDPIVSEDLFKKVQNILNGRKNDVKNYNHENPDFPLRRFVKHPTGKQLTGYWSQGKRLKYPYYSFTLPGTTYRKDMLEKKFMGFLSKYEFDNRHLQTLHNYLTKLFEGHFKNQTNEREVFEKRIIELNAQIDKLVELQEKGGISIAILAERTSKLENEITNLKDLLRNRPIANIDIAALYKFAANALQNLQILWEKSSFEKKKIFQVFVFPKGIMFDEVNFRTPEICSIFKLKEIIDSDLLPIVPYQFGENNTLSRTNFTDELKVYMSQEFWIKIYDDLIKLKDLYEFDLGDEAN